MKTEQIDGEQVHYDHTGLAKKERHVCSKCHAKRDVSLMYTMRLKTRWGKEKWYCNKCHYTPSLMNSPFTHGGHRQKISSPP